MNRRFDETFAAVAANFEEVAATLFPGGEGRLRLVEPDEEDGPEAEPGVEVELRPAGKRITRLTLLSGGEKALGAISFLFALFLAKPCPFYLLDEVEAALDDANIARFVELLRRYADRAQFVVITHQKRTMEAADVLYGVTMGGDGVSQIVSRRLPRDERARRPPDRDRRPGGIAVAFRAMSRTWAELLGDAEEGEREEAERSGFFARLRDSLGKSRRALVAELGASFDPAQEDAWERLEVALIRADVGVPATAELVRRLEARGERDRPRRGARRGGRGRSSATPPALAQATEGPTVVLVVGVNGTGKTTTIGKLAQKLRSTGARCSSAPPTRSARPPRSSSRSGPSARAPTSSAARGAPIPPRSPSTRSRQVAPGAGRRDRRHGRPAAHAGEPDGRAREGPARDRGPGRGRAARDAARRRRDHGPERPPAGAAVRRGRRA